MQARIRAAGGDMIVLSQGRTVPTAPGPGRCLRPSSRKHSVNRVGRPGRDVKENRTGQDDAALTTTRRAAARRNALAHFIIDLTRACMCAGRADRKSPGTARIRHACRIRRPSSEWQRSHRRACEHIRSRRPSRTRSRRVGRAATCWHAQPCHDDTGRSPRRCHRQRGQGSSNPECDRPSATFSNRGCHPSRQAIDVQCLLGPVGKADRRLAPLT